MEEGKEMQRQRGFLHFYDTEMEEDPMALNPRPPGPLPAFCLCKTLVKE